MGIIKINCFHQGNECQLLLVKTYVNIYIGNPSEQPVLNMINDVTKTHKVGNIGQICLLFFAFWGHLQQNMVIILQWGQAFTMSILLWLFIYKTNCVWYIFILQAIITERLLDYLLSWEMKTTMTPYTNTKEN